ncbi:hypothetical protein ACFY2T_08715 [Streptomyces sp. NPDC001260]|uniref:hypothetical protein n=1 Tax=Streptomyces sp. NPDC001260 TaxID=3364551 RepID=UPI003691A63C
MTDRQVSADSLPGRGDYDSTLDVVSATVAETYYAQQVQAVSAARGRAQAAQSTVTLFAGGLVAALSVATLTDRAWWTQALAVFAVAFWLVAAWCYLWAVSSPIKDDQPRTRVEERQVLVNRVLAKVEKEAEKVDSWQHRANLAAGIAVLLSLITFAATIVTNPVQETADGALMVDTSYRPALKAMCSAESARAELVSGRIVKSSLATPFVEIKPAEKVCTTPGVTLFIPRSKVKAVRWSDG